MDDLYRPLQGLVDADEGDRDDGAQDAAGPHCERVEEGRRVAREDDVGEQHRRGRPEITTFGDWRYESYTIYEPKGGAEYHEFAITAGDTAESPSARAAYPELSG